MQTCSVVVDFSRWGILGTACLWWIARGVGTLTGDDSHSLRLCIIYISQERCAKKSVDHLPCNDNLGLS